MLKIGVVGAGHLGKIHLNCINQLSEFELIGFYDTDPEVIETVQKEYQIKAFDSISALIEATDVIDIVTPTLSHFECAKQAIVAHHGHIQAKNNKRKGLTVIIELPCNISKNGLHEPN